MDATKVARVESQISVQMMDGILLAHARKRDCLMANYAASIIVCFWKDGNVCKHLEKRCCKLQIDVVSASGNYSAIRRIFIPKVFRIKTDRLEDTVLSFRQSRIFFFWYAAAPF